MLKELNYKCNENSTNNVFSFAQILNYMENISPELMALAEKAKLFPKISNVIAQKAKMAVCLDVSEDLKPYLDSGKTQHFAESVLALSALMDSNASIDVFLFGGRMQHAGEMTPQNFKGFIQKALALYNLEGKPDYSMVFREIQKFYFPDFEDNKPVQAADEPVFITFITNGETTDQTAGIHELARISYAPIFWHFMAIGKTKDDLGKGIMAWLFRPFAEDFSFLEKLDDMTERFIDNADFCNIPDPETLTDEELYTKMMQEYPDWLRLIKTKGMIK